MKKSCFLIAFIFLAATPFSVVFAGWIVRENNLVLDAKTITKIQGDKLISETNNEATIYNLETGEVILYYKDLKIYWSGSVEEYRKGLVSALQDLQKLFSGEMAVYLKDMIAASKQPLMLDFANNINIKFIRTSSAANIGGMNSVKYDIFVNGRIYKTLWLTETITPFRNVDIKSYIVWDKALSPSIGNDYFYEGTQDYIDLLKRGYITKTVNVEAASMVESVVEKVEITPIPETDFELPEGYTLMPIEELLFNSMKASIY